jgi:hypothetical protein
MMKLLAHLPDHIVGVSASGQIDAKDYETVLIPAILYTRGRAHNINTTLATVLNVKRHL